MGNGIFHWEENHAAFIITLHLRARLVERCRSGAVIQRSKSHTEWIRFSAGLHRERRQNWDPPKQIQWMPGLIAAERLQTSFLAQYFFISSMSGQSPTTDMFRLFSIKSVHSPFPFSHHHFLLPSSICCWHLLWHDTSGSKSLAQGLRAGTVRGHFCLLAEERKVGSAISSLVTQFPGHLPPKACNKYVHC